MKYARYPNYKPSKIGWLGELPDTWEVKRARFTALVNPSSNHARTLGPEDEVSFVPMDALGELGGLSLEQSRAISEIGNGYTEFENGDIVVAKITPCFENGKGALAEGLKNGVAYGTTELHVFRPHANLNSRFLFYLSISHPFRKLGEAEMYGAGGQKRIPPEYCKDFPIPLPPQEQITIVDFLDRETAKIDALVAKRQNLINRLKEKRNALISEAVTRGLPPEAAKVAGLNPHPKLRSSGIEGLGEIPEVWKTLKLGYVARLHGGYAFRSESFESEGIPIVQMNNLKRGRLETFDANRIDESECMKEFALNEGDLLFGMSGSVGETGSLGNFAVVHKSDLPAQLNQRVGRFKPKKASVETRFLSYMIQTPFFQDQILLRVTGTAQFNVSSDQVEACQAPIPPLMEQTAIADYLDRQTTNNDAMIGRIEAAITKLGEYRTALITAAVTGKIDVRNLT